MKERMATLEETATKVPELERLLNEARERAERARARATEARQRVEEANQVILIQDRIKT